MSEYLIYKSTAEGEILGMADIKKGLEMLGIETMRDIGQIGLKFEAGELNVGLFANSVSGWAIRPSSPYRDCEYLEEPAYE